ncbi:MAG TPA: hypothetical protein VMC84_01875 [Methanocella sp.]|uniref:hypothetical protein n=1 Tax=Methanocella sp. TaxID=2052833 RepID=UPI002B66E368|nr:hypothetical protein [Methanocella sp.]HTY89902.1 hypothetical protein [Methanocella sp.]
MVLVSRMGSKQDTQIVEFIVLLGVVNGFLYSLKFNPVNAFMNEVGASVTELIVTLTPQYSNVLLLLLQLLPAIVLIVSVIVIYRLGGATAITAVAFGFGCGYFALSDLVISILCLIIGLLLGLYSVKSDRLPIKKRR